MCHRNFSFEILILFILLLLDSNALAISNKISLESWLPLCDILKPEQTQNCNTIKINEISPIDIYTPAERDLTHRERLSFTILAKSKLDELSTGMMKKLLFEYDSFEFLGFDFIKSSLAPIRRNLLILSNYTVFKSVMDGLQAQLILNGSKSDPSENLIKVTSWTEHERLIEESLEEQPNNTLNQRDRFFKFIPKSQRSTYHNFKLLSDNATGFSQRLEMIATATRSIDILTWTILDDSYSRKLLTVLNEQLQKTPQLKVRILVDSNATDAYKTAEITKKFAILPRTEVIYFKDSLFTYGVQHRKMLLVDNEKCIAGGRNIGSYYFSTTGFIDDDIYFEGPLAQLSGNLFDGLWQEQILTQNLNYSNIQPNTLGQLKLSQISTEHFAGVLSEQPSLLYGKPSQTLLTIMNAIRSAQSSIRIANAYIIEFPILSRELNKAALRGVKKIDILTNSTESNDIPAMNLALLSSIYRLRKNVPAANIYLASHKTLHSKIMVVDDSFGMIGSYNLHPRSEKVDGELNYFFWDQDLAKSISERIDLLIENNMNLVESTDQIKFLKGSERPKKAKFWTRILIPESLFLLRFFYDQI